MNDEPVQRRKLVEDLTERDDLSAALDGLLSNRLAEGLDSSNLIILTELPLIPKDTHNPKLAPGSVQISPQVPPRIFEPKQDDSEEFVQAKAPGRTDLGKGRAQGDDDAKSRANKPAAAGFKSAQAEDRSPDPSEATENVEAVVTDSYKPFAMTEASKQKVNRQPDQKQDMYVKTKDFRNFLKAFRVRTPVPKDLLPILAKDVLRQNEIAAQAQRDAVQVSPLTSKK